MTTLDAIRCEDMNFPHAALVGNETALCVFVCAFQGNQDALWVADAGLRATLVDEDDQGLRAMRAIYPDDWEFVCGDAFNEGTYGGRQWDVVTLDPWTNDFTRTADMIGTWCRLARHTVIIGTGVNTVVEPPAGWEITDVRKRSDYDGGVYWTVVERA